MRYSATIHDRNLHSAAPATVRTEPGVLFIQMENGQILDWTLSDLDSARALDDGSVILQNGKKFLEVRDPGFLTGLERSFPKHRLFRHTFFDRIGMAGCLVAIAGVLAPILVLYFFIVPRVVESAAHKVPPEIEKQIGDTWFQSITATYKTDTALTRLVQQFYDSLGYGSGYDMRITVVHEPVVNAFAMPGGHIVVFDSILGIMDTPEQLAGLLAHEASHIQLRHSTRSIFRELANSLIFSLMLGDYGDLSTIIARHGDQLAGLSYSRSLELEADENGLNMMIEAGIPPRGMPDLFRKMKTVLEEPNGNADVPNFLSTHPSMEERMKIAEIKIDALGAPLFILNPALEHIWTELKNRTMPVQ
ncbi:MAG TPA: M48 family metallopeptidase [Saprospiraceae bacterium]|nr:M48 family metallopeptidase [Saprospiraceae bacterium]